ncbi:hypothetical protein B0J17DRAFT_629705 [Rhizoctonia solani]|nr:hypothetical protein B0J17DRAFT_629705 [Rhizoctonia solani]
MTYQKSGFPTKNESFITSDYDGSPPDDALFGRAAYLYMASWRLCPGYHIEAEAQLVTRHFITSSVFRDIIFSSDPRVIGVYTCIFASDREGSVLDAVGSIGGLFALLQAAHVLLFGAKLINPFGLLGICSSRGFKRWLREQYYRPSTFNEDGLDSFRTGAFLRDFVIEFGPADNDSDQPFEGSNSSKIHRRES